MAEALTQQRAAQDELSSLLRHYGIDPRNVALIDASGYAASHDPAASWCLWPENFPYSELAELAIAAGRGDAIKPTETGDDNSAYRDSLDAEMPPFGFAEQYPKVRIDLRGEEVNGLLKAGQWVPQINLESDAASIETDAVNSPAHYTAFGVELIEIIEHLPFNAGSVVKYVVRAGLKDPSKHIEDLQKARWYIDREISRVTKLEEAAA